MLNDDFPQENERLGRRAMAISLAVSFLMIVGKGLAFAITGSAAILSDAVESVVHIVATGFSAFGFRFAEKPPDREHPYGHGKVVVFSIGLEGTLIFLAALYVAYEATLRLLYGSVLTELGMGVLITAGLGAINLFLGLHLLSVGKKIKSPVVSANGHHVLTDMWTSVVVVVGVLAVWLSGLVWIDAVVALFAAAHILLTGVHIMRQAVDQTMDQASLADSEAIRSALQEQQANGHIIGFHELRHRKINNIRWIELHLLFDGSLALTEAHLKATRVEDSLRTLFSGERVHITSHLEPSDHEQAHPGGHSLGDPLSVAEGGDDS